MTKSRDRLQQQVNEMYAGNKDAILTGIESENDYLIINAIAAGAKHRLKSPVFIQGLERARLNKGQICGYPIASFAEAAIHYLNDVPYHGDDNYVMALIKMKFNIGL